MAKKPTPQQGQQRSHVRTRAFAGAPTTVSEDGRRFDIVIYTETPCRTRILDPRTDVYIDADEVLLASGLDLSQSPRMPLVNNHDSYGDIRSTVLGRIDDIRIEGQTVVGRATLSNLHKDLGPDIAEGFLGNISATYYADQYEIQDRAGDVPLAIAHRTVLLDGSFVPVGADPNTSVRGQNGRTFPAPKMRSQTPAQETVMDELETAVAAAEEAIAALDEAVAAAGDTADAELLERARAVREIADEEDPDKLKDEGARAEGDDLTEEEKKKEDEEIRGLRSIASTYGLSKTVDDLKKLGARAKDIKVAVRNAITHRGAASSAAAPVVELKQRSKERHAQPGVDYRSVYDRMKGGDAKASK
jgi:hypothetical protein